MRWLASVLFLALLISARTSSAAGICTSYGSDLMADLSRAAETEGSATEKAKDPLHADKDEVDPKGYGNSRGDNDGDGVRNDRDAFPNDPRNSSDSDGDGVGDTSDAFPKDPEETLDSDCDGIGDNADKEFNGLGCVSSTKRWSGDGVYGQNIAYDMVMTPDKVVHVTLRVKLDGARDSKREAIWEHWAEKMWTHGNMTLDVQWVETNPHKTVSVYRGSGRANSGTYYTASDKWVVAHEIGHLLGLHDEYYDRSDPNRLMGERDALMAYNFDGARTYPRYHALIREHFDSDKSRPAVVADLPESYRQDAEDEPQPELVACPEGTSKYESVKEDYKELFCKKDGEKTYLAYTRGSWWEWQEHLDDGSVILEHPVTGERKQLTASDLVRVAPPGTVIDPPPVTDPEPVEPTPSPPKRVACPEGTSKYESVKEDYKELFCKNDGERTYLAYVDGAWWEWEEHLDDGSVLLRNPAGGHRVKEASELTPTAPTGTIIEPEIVVADAEPVEVDEDEFDSIDWGPVEDIEEEVVVSEPEPEPEETVTTTEEETSAEEEEEEEVVADEGGEEAEEEETEAGWPRPGPPPWWHRNGRPPPPWWVRGGRRPGFSQQGSGEGA